MDLISGDCLDVLDYVPAASVDAVVTDPPYHLQSIHKRFAKVGRDDKTWTSSGPHQRTAAGFMNQQWDGGDIAFRPEVWAKCYRAMKPGAHLLAFGGTRTYHRLACAIEDAGFEIRDQIGWVYGSGFPKSHNLDGQWEGWGTALKPAWEPIVLARKPLDGTVAANVLAHGTGAINIEACRVASAESTRRQVNTAIKGGNFANGGTAVDGTWGGSDVGRWPANLIHDGSDEVVGMFPNDAARFFYCAKASRSDRNDGLEAFEEKPLLWSAGTQNPGSFQSAGTKKAAKNNHPTVKPTELMRYLCRLITPPGGLVLDPFMGSGSTGRGAVFEGFRFLGIEQDAGYLDIARARIAAVSRMTTDTLDVFD